MVDYASICHTILPQTFEYLNPVDATTHDSPHTDIDHMPLYLQQELASNKSLWDQYCDIFLKIIKLLEHGESPTQRRLDSMLSEDIITRMGGSEYVLKYLLKIVEKIGYKSSNVVGIEKFPICWNDFTYTTIRQNLLDA